MNTITPPGFEPTLAPAALQADPTAPNTNAVNAPAPLSQPTQAAPLSTATTASASTTSAANARPNGTHKTTTTAAAYPAKTTFACSAPTQATPPSLAIAAPPKAPAHPIANDTNVWSAPTPIKPRMFVHPNTKAKAFATQTTPAFSALKMASPPTVSETLRRTTAPTVHA